jgi:hypothetical protein
MQVLMTILRTVGFGHRAPPKKRELKLVTYAEGDTMLKANEGWKLAWEEDTNNRPGVVYLERYV